MCTFVYIFISWDFYTPFLSSSQKHCRWNTKKIKISSFFTFSSFRYTPHSLTDSVQCFVTVEVIINSRFIRALKIKIRVRFSVMFWVWCGIIKERKLKICIKIAIIQPPHDQKWRDILTKIKLKRKLLLACKYENKNTTAALLLSKHKKILWNASFSFINEKKI
jgi:hypothetical protein